MSRRVALLFTCAVVGLAVVFLAYKTIAPHYTKTEMQLGDFASLPVVDGGRVMPADSLARNSLLIISGKQTFVDKKDKEQPAIKWLLDVMSAGPRLDQNEAALDHKVFRIENLQVLDLLGLQPRHRFRYAIREFMEKFDDLDKEIKRAMDRRENHQTLTLFDTKILELSEHLKIFLDLAHWKSPRVLPPFREGTDWETLLGGLQDNDPVALAYREMLYSYARDNTETFNEIVGLFHKELEKKMSAVMGPTAFEVFFNRFAPFYNCAILYGVIFLLACFSWVGWSLQGIGRMVYGIVCFATFFSFVGTVLGGIWADQSWGRFWGWDPKENGALIIVLWNALILHARWGGLVKQRGMALLAIGGNIVTAWSWFGVNMLGVGLHSYGFMSGALFWLILFAVSQLLIIGLGSLPLSSWRMPAAEVYPQWTRDLNHAAFWLMIVTFTVHTLALFGRMYLQGRPPVTNLYSSAVFIGWGGVILGLVLEGIFKNGIGNCIGAALGGLTLIIAHHLSASGDTLAMMQAVLDTNFWLATHVTCVTMGYTATFVAGFLGILYVGLGVGRPLWRSLFQVHARPASV